MKSYRLLLLLYPRWFRRRYGDEWERDFAGLMRQARVEGGRGRQARLFLSALVDSVVAGIRQRLSGPTQSYKEEGQVLRTLTDLRYAWRRLRRAPAYSVTFVLTLGLALGVNSAVFSVVNAVLLQPLPFQDAERILYLKQPIVNTGVENANFSFLEVDDYREAATTIDEFVEYGDWEFTVLGDDEPHRAVGGLVTSNYFGVLGMRPTHGRLLNDQDDLLNSEPVMVLTYEYWDRQFGRDLSVIGSSLRLENLNDPFISTRVVGILEPGIHYTGSRRPDFYVNYAANDHYQGASMRDSRSHRMTSLFARLAPGASITSARAELEAIATRLHREYPADYDADLGYGIEAVPWEYELTHTGRTTFLFLLGTVSVVLLLAAFNVANVMLTRLIRLEGELATRVALGASAANLRFELAMELAILGLFGGGLGLLMALASQDALVAYAARFTVRANEVGVDWTVLGVTLGAGVILSILLAWMPGVPIGSVGQFNSMRSRTTDSRGRRRLQRGLVVSQLALSFALLAGAGVLVRGMIELTDVPPGFRTDQILTLRTPVGPSGGAFPFGDFAKWPGIVDEIESYPGVRTVAVASWAPFGDVTPSSLRPHIDGEVDANGTSYPAASNNVSVDYFELLGIPLLEGRFFNDGDHEDAPDVIILNESMARAHFGDESPIGHKISFTPDFNHVFFPTTYEIVGVVADSHEYGLGKAGIHTFYRPTTQNSWGPAVLIAHEGTAAGVGQHAREVLRRALPDQAVQDVETLAARMEDDYSPMRLNTLLFGSFAVLALVIAAVGVLGTLAFSVSRRVREFGIRMALGARRDAVVGVVLGEALLLIGIALVIGAVLAGVLGRFANAFIYGAGASDIVATGTAALVLVLVGLGAALVPALRASRIEPVEALRE